MRIWQLSRARFRLSTSSTDSVHPHEIQKIETWDYEDLKDMADMDAIDEFRKNALNPNHPCQKGSAQNPDIFFQVREACNPYYEALPAIVQGVHGQG